AQYSRSLLNKASEGVVAELSEDSESAISQSIVMNDITAAICVPVMLGQTVAAYLYLDARSARAGAAGRAAGRAGASAFALALGRMAGLALSNLKRTEMEHRHAVMQAE